MRRLGVRIWLAAAGLLPGVGSSGEEPHSEPARRRIRSLSSYSIRARPSPEVSTSEPRGSIKPMEISLWARALASSSDSSSHRSPSGASAWAFLLTVVGNVIACVPMRRKAMSRSLVCLRRCSTRLACSRLPFGRRKAITTIATMTVMPRTIQYQTFPSGACAAATPTTKISPATQVHYPIHVGSWQAPRDTALDAHDRPLRGNVRDPAVKRHATPAGSRGEVGSIDAISASSSRRGTRGRRSPRGPWPARGAPGSAPH